MMAAEFARLVKHPRRRADGTWWDARCPAHEDQRSSLSFRDGDHALVLECHRGCTRDGIAAALGRRVDDFTHRKNGSGPARTRRREVATYDYTDAAGTLCPKAKRTSTRSGPSV
jgi:hypothetical protein